MSFHLLKVQESAFQNAWFIESILTELFILFIIRTHKNYSKRKPGKYLFILSTLPYTALAAEIALTPLALLNFSIMLIIVVIY
jgi:Mg2+-importing ATPase